MCIVSANKAAAAATAMWNGRLERKGQKVVLISLLVILLFLFSSLQAGGKEGGLLLLALSRKSLWEDSKPMVSFQDIFNDFFLFPK